MSKIAKQKVVYIKAQATENLVEITGGSARLDESKFDDLKLQSSSSCVSENANVNVLDIQSSKGSWAYNANLSSTHNSPEIKNRLKHIKS